MLSALYKKGLAAVLGLGVLLPVAAMSAHAQYDRRYDRNRNSQFYDGARRGGSGNYYNGRDHRYDDRYYNDNRDNRYNDGRYQGHGIGTGRGALIGGAGGAALGALFGGGLKGTLIGGGAGAGIGALIGHQHQQSQKRKYYERRDGYYPR